MTATSCVKNLLDHFAPMKRKSSADGMSRPKQLMAPTEDITVRISRPPIRQGQGSPIVSNRTVHSLNEANLDWNPNFAPTGQHSPEAPYCCDQGIEAEAGCPGSNTNSMQALAAAIAHVTRSTQDERQLVETSSIAHDGAVAHEGRDGIQPTLATHQGEFTNFYIPSDG